MSEETIWKKKRRQYRKEFRQEMKKSEWNTIDDKWKFCAYMTDKICKTFLKFAGLVSASIPAIGFIVKLVEVLV